MLMLTDIDAAGPSVFGCVVLSHGRFASQGRLPLELGYHFSVALRPYLRMR